jgi:hypothetical protein
MVVLSAQQFAHSGFDAAHVAASSQMITQRRAGFVYELSAGAAFQVGKRGGVQRG